MAQFALGGIRGGICNGNVATGPWLTNKLAENAGTAVTPTVKPSSAPCAQQNQLHSAGFLSFPPFILPRLNGPRRRQLWRSLQ